MSQPEAGRRIGANVHLSPDTRLGDGVEIGNNVTIHPCVTIGDGCRIQDGAVIGRLPIAGGGTTLPLPSEHRPVEIGAGSVVGANSVIYTDVRIGRGVLIGDVATVREDNRIGDDCVIGQHVAVHHGGRIGCRVRVLYFSVVGGVIEDDVFVGPGFVGADDGAVYLSRFGLARPEVAPFTLRRFSVIGTGVTIMPHVEVGEGAFAASGALLRQDVPAWTIVAGVPARHLREVPAEWREKILAHHAR